MINRQLKRKRTDSQNHASFEFRRFVTLAASFDLWTRSLGAIYFLELGMSIHHLGLFCLVSEGYSVKDDKFLVNLIVFEKKNLKGLNS